MNGLANGVKAVKSVSMRVFFRFADWDDRTSTVPPSIQAMTNTVVMVWLEVKRVGAWRHC